MVPIHWFLKWFLQPDILQLDRNCCPEVQSPAWKQKKDKCLDKNSDQSRFLEIASSKAKCNIRFPRIVGLTQPFIIEVLTGLYTLLFTDLSEQALGAITQIEKRANYELWTRVSSLW